MTAGQLKIKGTQLYYRDNDAVERLLTGEAVAGTFDGNLKVKGTYLHYMDNNGAQKRLLGTLTGNTGTAGRLKVKGQCIRYIDNSGYEREVCAEYPTIFYVVIPFGAQALRGSDAVYSIAHDKDNSDKYITSRTLIGQTWDTGSGIYWAYEEADKYGLFRTAVVFNTPSIGSIATAKLRIYCDVKSVDTQFNIVVVRGDILGDQPVAADYGTLVDESESRGSIASADITQGMWFEIELNAIGISEITTPVTKFGIRSSREITGSVPSEGVHEVLQCHASHTLVVTYE